MRTRRRRTGSRSRESKSETRWAEGATVAWMLCTLSCVTAQAACVVFSVYAGVRGEYQGFVSVLGELSLAIASLTGLIVLLLTPVVYWLRKTRPPVAVTIGSLGLAMLPLAVFAATAAHR